LPLPPPPQPKTKSPGEGFPWGGLFLVLIVLVPLLGYNYLLNLEAEKRDVHERPYRNYPTEDLESMIQGYESEIVELEKKLGQVKASRVGPQDVQLLDEQIDEFQRMANQTREQRDASIQLGQAEVMLKDLRKEKSLRGNDPKDLALHMHRLFDFKEFRRKH